MDKTKTESRTSSMEEAFHIEEAPTGGVPAAIQQVMIDDRPQGAMKVQQKRDLAEVLRNIKTVATAAGDDFFYSWPTKNKDGTTGVVEGPSVKCANAVARIYGNCSVKVRAFDQGPHWIFYAQFYDMETGFVYERPFQQRKAQNIGGKMDKDRATDIVFQIGASKAARNAVTNALSEFTDYAFDVAKEQLVEKIGKNLPTYLARVLERLVELKINKTRVEAIRGKPSDKWLAADLARTIAEIQACNDGMAHPDELWPPAEAGAPRPGPFKEEDDFIDDRTPEQKAADKRDAKSDNEKDGNGKPQAETVKQEPTVTQAEPDPKSTQPAENNATPKADQPSVETAKPAAEQIDKAVEAFAAEEWRLDAFKTEADGLPGCKTAAEVDQMLEKVRVGISNSPDLDAEDKAVLQGRWNTMCLERKRALTRRRPK